MNRAITTKRHTNRFLIALLFLAACSGGAAQGPTASGPVPETPASAATATPAAATATPAATTATPAATAPPVAIVNVNIYRGLDARPNGHATLSPSQFRFNPTLSNFANPNQSPVAKACNYRFTVTGVVHDPPQPNDHGPVAGLAGYTATFDNNPPGHWGISQPAGVDADAAAAAVSQYANDNRGNIVNGTMAPCN